MELDAYLHSLGWRGELVRKLTYVAAIIPLAGGIAMLVFKELGFVLAWLCVYLIFIPVFFLDLIVFFYFKRSQHRNHKHIQQA